MKTINILDKMTPCTIDPLVEVRGELNKIGEQEERAVRVAGFLNSYGPVTGRKQDLNRLLYTEKEIRRICLLYDFRFHSPEAWRGNPDPLLGKKIVDYCNRNDASIHSTIFKILAPTETFHTYTAYDPILFAYAGRDQKGGLLYEYIYQWGNDISAKRMLTSFVRLFTFYDDRKGINPSGVIFAKLFTSLIIFAALIGICATILSICKVHVNYGGSKVALGIIGLPYLVGIPLYALADRFRFWKSPNIGTFN